MSWNEFSEQRDRVTSKSGGWTIGGDATLHGFNLHQELASRATWMQTMVLSATGQFVSAKQAQLIETAVIMTGYPDPRLWCNRVASLAGSAKCTATASFAAGIASAEASLYGRQSDYKAACLLLNAKRIYDADGKEGLSLFIQSQLQEKRIVYGFGRPLLRGDERIAPLSAAAAKLGIDDGNYLSVAMEIEQLLRKYKMIINYGGYMMARFLDMGFMPKQIYRMLSLAFYTGVVPCYIEAFENESGTFLPIACEDILYEGVEERELP